MKKLYISIMASAAISATLLSSCKKVLDKQPETTLTSQQVFSDSLITVFYLNTLYTNNLPTWGGNSGGAIGSPGGLTEENTGGAPFTSGAVTVETVGDIGTSNTNGNNYGKLRNINDFIQGMRTSPIDEPTKRRFIGQAMFWRAYRYFELVKLYGGVPIETVPLSIVGPDAKLAANLPRNSTKETFAQIRADLDSATAYLPAIWPKQVDYGRITKGAAQAFLGRVLLTYASPQFNPNNDVARWQDALTVCNAAITTLSNAGYGLYPKEDVTMWTTEGGTSSGKPNNIEAVMVTEYGTGTTTNSSNNSYTASGIPKSLFGGGGNNPTWDEVQAFPMADGLKPANASTAYPYNAKLFFDNRDPRFYQTIAYNGCNWPLEGNAAYRLWTYFFYTNTAGTAASTTETSGSSSTGFYCRKAIDPNIGISNLTYSGTDWQEIRYAEVILNRAECAAATGDLTTAFNDLVTIRKRAGIVPGAGNTYGLGTITSVSAMIDAIMYERQIEFAYEGKRYWDLRRRKLLEPTLNGKFRQGLTITLNNTGTGKDYLALTRDGLAATSLDNVYLTYFNGSNGEVPKNIDTTPITYTPNQYFFGIPTNALKSDIGLNQNNTWGGPFDPLAGL
jgi:hypothetical protein